MGQNKNTIEQLPTANSGGFDVTMQRPSLEPVADSLEAAPVNVTSLPAYSVPKPPDGPTTPVIQPVQPFKPPRFAWVIVLILALGVAGTYMVLSKHQTPSAQTVNSQTNSPSDQNTNLGSIKGESVTFGIDTKISGGKTLTATGPVIVQNTSDKSVAFQVQDASGSNLFVADSQNGKIGIGATPVAGGATLQVGGSISATGSISANDGSTSLSNQGLKIDNVLICTSSGCSTLAAQAATGKVFTGDASTLNGESSGFFRNASNINNGTLSDEHLSGNVALVNAGQTFVGINAFTAAGNTFVGDGSGLSSLRAGNITTGTLNDSRLSSNVALLARGNTFSGVNNFSNSANTFAGDGSALTGVDADTLNGQSGSFYTNASNITAGTLADSQLSTNVTLAGNSFNAPGGLVMLDGSGLLPALDGSALTNLDASSISIGTLDDSLLSSNVALLDANNSFSGNNDFTSILKVKNTSTSAFQIQKADGSGNLMVADTSNGRIAIGQASASYTLDVNGDINSATAFRVAGIAGSDLSCSSGDLVQDAVISGGIITGGSCVAPAVVSTPTLQNVYDSSVTSPQITLSSARGGVVIQDAASPITGNLLAIQSNGGSTKYLTVTTSGATVAGNINITGNYQVGGVQISTTNLSDGASITKQGNSFNGIAQLVQTDGSGKLPGLDGSNVSNVNAASLGGNVASYYTNATNLASGTVNDSRLSANIAKLNANQTYSGNNTYSGANSFTGVNTFSLSTSGLAVQDAASPLGTNLFSITNSAGTTNYFSVSASGAKIGTNDICTTAGNCAGAGSGVTTSGGTTGKLAKFSGSQAIGDSIISDNGTTATINGTLAVNTITPTATLTVGTASQTLVLQGDASSKLTATSGGFTNSLVFVTPASASHSINLPNASGTVAVSASGPLALDAAGNLTCPTCLTSGGGGGTAGVSSVNSITGAITLAGTTNQITITPASSTITFSLPQDIATSSTPTFANINVGAGGQFRINGTQISSSALSNDSNLAKINGANVFTGANSSAPTTDVTGLSIKQTTAGTPTSDVFNVTNSGGTTKYLAVSAAGTVTTSGTLNATTLQQGGTAVLLQNTSFGGDVSGSYNSLAIGTGKVTSTNILDGTVSNLDISGSAAIAYSKLNLATSIVNADISTSAAIAYSKLNLATSIVNADISASAAITYSKLSLNNSIVNTDISTSAAIAYSKLNLAGSVTNADIAAGAGIADSKLATITTAGKVADTALSSKVVLNDANTTFSGNNTFSGTLLQKNTATTAFQIQKADGTGTVFTADTTNTRIAIGQTSASYALDVNGDINASSGLRVAGTLICSTTGCTPGSGSGNYIQNGTSQQSSANFNISGSGTIGTNLSVTGTSSLTGNVGVGTSANANVALAVSKSFGVSPVDQSAGIATNVNLQPSANFNGAYGTTSNISVAPATGTTTSYVVGNLSQAYVTGGGGTVNGLYGIQARNGVSAVSPAATVGSGRAVYVDSIYNPATGTPNVTFNNQYGVYVANQGAGNGTNGLTIQNAYGLYLAATSGATSSNYSIYSAGGNNYLAGALGIGGSITLGSGTASTISQWNTGNGNIAVNHGLIVNSANDAGNGIYFGSAVDTNLYRQSAGVLQTDGQFRTGNGLLIAQTQANPTTAAYGIGFGSGADANLYRSATNTLKTDGDLQVVGVTSSGSVLSASVSSGASQALTVTANASSTWSTASGTLTLQGGSGLTVAAVGTNSINFNTNGSVQASLDSNGNFTLSGNGLIVAGSKASDPTCTAGSLYYNTTNSSFRGCAGAPLGWQDLLSPVGTVVPYAGSAAPNGYLVADGSAVSRTSYSRLFAVIGTTYGVGDGSTTFNLPDLRGRTAVGLNTSETGRTDVSALGNNEGAAIGNRTPVHMHTVVQPTISKPSVVITDPGHSHSIYNFFGGGVTQSGALCGCNNGGGTTSTNSSTTGITAALSGNPVASGGTVGPQSNTPTDTAAYLTLNYIIKY